MAGRRDEGPVPATAIPTVDRALAEGDRERARVALRAALDGLEDQSDEQVVVGARACEELGLVSEAIRACRILIQRHPRDGTIWARLAELHTEAAHPDLAARCLDRARQLGAVVPGAGSRGIDPEGFAPPADAPHLRFDRADLARFLDLFAGREDAHARQWVDPDTGRGGYSPVREPLTAASVRAHLSGRETLGAYVVRADGTAGFVVIDIDLSRSAVEAARGDGDAVEAMRIRLDRATRSLAGALGQLGLPFLVEDSGWKGRHLWVFLDQGTPASEARAFGAALVRAHRPQDPALRVEVFPKQDQVHEGGLGNLVKLPLGFHRVSGRRAVLLRADGREHPEPVRALRDVQRVDRGALAEATADLRARPAVPDPADPDGDDEDASPRRRTGAPRPVPPFTEADLRRDPEFAAVLGGCAVVERLTERALAGDALGHDEISILRYVLGHLGEGPRGVNFLLQKVPDVGDDHLMGRRLRGSPMSCARIRERSPGTAARVGCDCVFGGIRTTYANPLLHLGDAGGESELVELEGDAGERPGPVRSARDEPDDDRGGAPGSPPRLRGAPEAESEPPSDHPSRPRRRGLLDWFWK